MIRPFYPGNQPEQNSTEQEPQPGVQGRQISLAVEIKEGDQAEDMVMAEIKC